MRRPTPPQRLRALPPPAIVPPPGSPAGRLWTKATAAWPILLTTTSPTAVLDLGAQVRGRRACPRPNNYLPLSDPPLPLPPTTPPQALARFDVSLVASAPGLGLSLSWWERRNASSGDLSHGYWTSTYLAAGEEGGGD